MRLTVFGASGGVGRHVVEQARQHGYQVTAVVRDLAKAPPSAAATQLDLSRASTAAIADVVAESDAVISCIGAATKADVGIATEGTRRILAGMQQLGLSRLVVVSAAPVAGMPSPDRFRPVADTGEDRLTRLVLSPLLRRVLSSVYTDLARMEDELRGSAAAWTAVRPPRLTNGPLTGQYRTAIGRNLPHGRSIARADLAHLLLRLPLLTDSVHQPVGVAY